MYYSFKLMKLQRKNEESEYIIESSRIFVNYKTYFNS